MGSIVTMDSDGTPFAKVHDRMSIFLTPETAALWLDPSVSYAAAIKAVAGAAQEHARKELLMYEVSTLVSNVRNESPDCILPKTEVDKKRFAGGLGKFFTKAPKETAQTDGDTGKAAAALADSKLPLAEESSRKRPLSLCSDGGAAAEQRGVEESVLPPTKAARFQLVQTLPPVVIDLDDD